MLESLNLEWSGALSDPGGVRVYYLESGKMTPEEQEYLAALLNKEERGRRDRFRNGEARSLFEMSHGLTRMALSRWLADERGIRVDPATWRFTADRLGKPRAFVPKTATEPPLFSLSHTRGAALVAVASGGMVGVDLESADRLARALPLARRFFAREEYADIASQPDGGAARERFIFYWTLKEAYLKALGFGLAQSLASFAFAPDKGSARLLYDHGGIKGAWRFAILGLSGGMRGALAIRLAK